MRPKPLLTNDQAKKDFMIIMSARRVLLKYLTHCSGIQVFVNLGVSVKEYLGHLVTYSTSKPVVYNIDCKSTLSPPYNRVGKMCSANLAM
jgi:hypothetical protein